MKMFMGFAFFAVIHVSPAFSATNFVTSLNDSGSGSLRVSIAASSPGDTLVITASGQISLVTGPLVIVHSLNVVGSGPQHLSIDGNASSRIFDVTSGFVSLSGFTLTNGKTPDGVAGVSGTDGVSGTLPTSGGSGGPGGSSAAGGCIHNTASLTLSNCWIVFNRTGNGGSGGRGGRGGNAAFGVTNPPGDGGYGDNGGNSGDGGAIFNAGALTILGCSISNNWTGAAGDGGNGGDGGTSQGPQYGVGGGGDTGGAAGRGGAIYNAGTLTIIRSTLYGNATGRGAAGGSAGLSGNFRYSGRGAGNGASGGAGGAICSPGTATLVDSVLSFNNTGNGGPGGNGYDISGMSRDGGEGGAIQGNAKLLNCLLAENSSGNGADAPSSGSYLSIAGSGGNGAGGQGTIFATNCTFLNNRAGRGGGGFAWGGGWAGNGGALSGTGIVLNCTFAGNEVPSTGRGAGFYGSGYIVSCTIANNSSNANGAVFGDGPLQLRNCIVAHNGTDVSGACLSLGHNLIGVTNGITSFGGTGDLFSTNPLLGLLSTNAGIIPTFPLLPGGPAIDAGDDGVLVAATTDQRGLPRRAGAHVDIGACESQLWLARPSRNSGNATFTVSGVPGFQHVIEVSSNLSAWLPFATSVVPSSGATNVLFAEPSAWPQRYYRARRLSAGAPLNDLFANRILMTGTNLSVSGSNVGASMEAGEAYHWETTGGSSVWWSWQAPASRAVTITTGGSGFDTIVAVYTGNNVAALNLVGNNDDAEGTGASAVTFDAVSGVVYAIAVDGYAGAQGNIFLSLRQ